MANLYDLKKFDLNLLVIFECIYQHLSISKAAETLFITPSAVSQSLQRLRTQFNDPLFIHSGKGITPTVTGINLHHHLEQNLNSLEQTINIMHNSSLKKKFIIYCPPMTTSFHLHEVVHSLREDSDIDIEIEHHDILMSAETAENILSYRKADLVLTIVPVHNRSIVCMPLKTIEGVLVRNSNHPRINDSSTIEQLLKEKFTLFLTEEQGMKDYQSQTNHFLANRKIGFSSDSLISIVNVISNTDIIGVIPRVMYDFYSPVFNLKEISVDMKLPSAKLYMMYNRASLSNDSFASYIKKIIPDSE